MEDSQAYNFVVKSQIHDYSVEFINDLETTLKNELIEGDFIIIDNKIINLGPTEYRLLEFFLTHQERVYTRDQILNFVWGSMCILMKGQ